MKPALLFIIVLLLTGCSTSFDESSKRLTEEAATLTSPASDDAELRRSLGLLDEAIELDDAYLPARKHRIGVLVRLGELDAAADEAKAVAQLSGSPQDYLFQCMAREVSEPEYKERQECYIEASRRYESAFDEPATDINYVLALKLADSDRFESAAEQFLDSLPAEASRDLFEPLLHQSDRDQIISDLFYSSY